MSEPVLTKEERRSLQLWFRQAIAEVEKAEVTTQLIKRHGIAEADGHRSNVSRRRAPRNLQSTHHKELVTQ